MQRSAKSVPRLVRRAVPGYEWRHVKGFAAVRSLVALWLVVLGSIVCAHGLWWGALLYIGAALAGFAAYQMPRWKGALDAEEGAPARRPG